MDKSYFLIAYFKGKMTNTENYFFFKDFKKALGKFNEIKEEWQTNHKGQENPNEYQKGPNEFGAYYYSDISNNTIEMTLSEIVYDD